MPQQILISGQTKLEASIDFIRKHEPENEPYFVGISGGKDSSVLYKLVKMAGVRAEYYYSATGIDPPELVKFIKREFPDVIFKKPKENFYKLIYTRGQPTMRRRWCCTELKKTPVNNSRVPLKHRLFGIRAEESPSRAKRGAINFYKRFNQWWYCPIFDWLEWEVWDFIESHNIAYCSLYDEGFDRLGCVVCPYYQGRPILFKYKKRWPAIYRAFERAMLQLYKDGHKKNKPWKEDTFEEFLNYWYFGKQKTLKDVLFPEDPSV